MAVSASQLQELLKEAFPSDPAQMQVTDIMVPSGRIRYVDEIIGQGESGPMYGSRPEPEMVLGGYYSPALGRQLTAAETQHLIPIQSYVDGHGQVTTGLVYPGEKAVKLFNELGYTGSQMSGQATPGGFEVYPLPGTIPTDQGDRTNIAISYGASGAPEARVYQSSTLTGSASLDKIVDQLAKAANAALLTQVGGLTLGPLGVGVLANPAVAGAVAGAGQAAIKGGDTKDLLAGALSGYLQAPGSAEITALSDLAKIEASMGVPTGVAPGLLASISPEVAAANLGALESSLGTLAPTGVSPSDLAAIEASMGPTVNMQIPQVPGLQGARLEDIFAGFGEYNEAAGNLLSQAQQPFTPFANTETFGSLINEPVRVPGDNRLVDTLAQPPLAVEDISGQLSPEAKRLMGILEPGQPGPLLDLPISVEPTLAPQSQLPDMPKLPGVQQPPAGNLDKKVLLVNEGYGDLSNQTITEAPIETSPITSLGPDANLKDFIDYIKGGAFVGKLGDAFKEAFKAATGDGQQQGKGDGLGGLGPIIGGLLSRAPTTAPAAPVTPGRPVDITSPIQSLLAPKLVQQRPVTLL